MRTITPEASRIALVPPSAAVHVVLFLLAVALPVAAVTVAAWQVDAATPIPRPVLAGVVLFSAALYWLLRGMMRRHHVVVGDGTLEVTTTFYRRTLAISELDLHAARVVDLDERTELRPMLKTNGAALPGFHSGWFRLRNRRKALVATASGTRALWIPTRAGYDLLLQPSQPQALLDRLRAMAAGGDRG